MKKMAENGCTHVIVEKYNDTFAVRFQTRECARALGLGPYDQARISLAAGELAQILFVNCIKHPEFIISKIDNCERFGILVVGTGFLSIPDDSGIGPQIIDSLQKAICLVDEGDVEDQDNQETRVSIIQWK